MQIKTSRKSFWQSLTALIGVTLIVGTGSAQTVSIDSAPALNLRTSLDGTGLALSSISIDPLTGNAQVNTTSNVNSCGGIPGTRSVTVTSPVNASQNATITVSWEALNFTGATTCTVSLNAGSAAPVSGWAGSSLPYPATNRLSVLLASTQPAEYRFNVQCTDGQVAVGSANTTVENIVGCVGNASLEKWRGATLASNNNRIWENTFISPGQPFTPFPGPVFSQLRTEPSNSGTYDNLRFTVPTTLTVGARFNIANFTPTDTPSSTLAFSVSDCKGDFRESVLINETTNNICFGFAGITGPSIRLKVEPGVGPFTTPTCPIVRGRSYYVNTTFGVAGEPGPGQLFCAGLASGIACGHLLEYQLSR